MKNVRTAWPLHPAARLRQKADIRSSSMMVLLLDLQLLTGLAVYLKVATPSVGGLVLIMLLATFGVAVNLTTFKHWQEAKTPAGVLSSSTPGSVTLTHKAARIEYRVEGYAYEFRCPVQELETFERTPEGNVTLTFDQKRPSYVLPASA